MCRTTFIPNPGTAVIAGILERSSFTGATSLSGTLEGAPNVEATAFSRAACTGPAAPAGHRRPQSGGTTGLDERAHGLVYQQADELGGGEHVGDEVDRLARPYRHARDV